jgi:hypothetical protein
VRQAQPDAGDCTGDAARLRWGARGSRTSSGRT